MGNESSQIVKPEDGDSDVKSEYASEGNARSPRKAKATSSTSKSTSKISKKRKSGSKKEKKESKRKRTRDAPIEQDAADQSGGGVSPVQDDFAVPETEVNAIDDMTNVVANNVHMDVDEPDAPGVHEQLDEVIQEQGMDRADVRNKSQLDSNPPAAPLADDIDMPQATPKSSKKTRRLRRTSNSAVDTTQEPHTAVRSLDRLIVPKGIEISSSPQHTENAKRVSAKVAKRTAKSKGKKSLSPAEVNELADQLNGDIEEVSAANEAEVFPEVAGTDPENSAVTENNVSEQGLRGTTNGYESTSHQSPEREIIPNSFEAQSAPISPPTTSGEDGHISDQIGSDVMPPISQNPQHDNLQMPVSSLTPRKSYSKKRAKTPILSSKQQTSIGWVAVNSSSRDDPPAPQVGVYKVNDTPSTKRKRKSLPDLAMGDNGIETSGKKKAKVSQNELPEASKKAINGTAKSTPKSIPRAESKSSVKSSQSEKSSPIKKSEAKPIPSQHSDSGRFVDAELEVIDLELLKYREMHDMDEHEQNQLIAGSSLPEPAKELWNQLCEALPGRSRISIIKICRRKYHNFPARGKWTKEEDEMLSNLQAKFPNRWKQIGQVMTRNPEDVRDRWRNYVICGDNRVAHPWAEDDEAQLRAAVDDCVYSVQQMKRDHQALHPDSEQYTQPDIDYVDWQVVSAQMGHSRSRLQCMTKWRAMEDKAADIGGGRGLDLDHKSWRIDQARRESKEFSRSDKLQLLQAIQDSKVGREGKISWHRLVSGDLNKWPTMVKKVAWTKLRATVERNQEMKLQEIVELLIRKYSPLEDETMSQPTSSRHVTPRRKDTAGKLSSTRDPISSSQHKSNEFIVNSDTEDNGVLEADTRAGDNVPASQHSNKTIGSARSKRKKLIESMATADATDQEHNSRSKKDTSQKPMGFDIDHANTETPTKKSKRTTRKVNKRNRRVSPIQETPSPRRTVNNVEDDLEGVRQAARAYDSSDDDHDMSDIPATVREDAMDS